MIFAMVLASCVPATPRRKTAFPVRWTVLLLLISCLHVCGQDKRAITPADCVTVHYLPSEDPYRRSITLNPQGDWIAYLVKEPNLVTNANDISVYVRKISSAPQEASTRITTGIQIGELTWLHSGREITFLEHYRGHVAIMKADVTTGTVSPLYAIDDDIAEYTIDWAGDVIAYSTNLPAEDVGHLSHSPEEIASGYRVPAQESVAASRRKRELFLVKRVGGARWGMPKPVKLQSPFRDESTNVLSYYLHFALSLSPDGGKLAATYPEPISTLPKKWHEDATMHQLESVAQELYILVVYDVATSRTSFPLASPDVYSIPAWDKSGQTLIVNADPPIGSKWRQEEAGHNIFFSPHMFSIDLADGKVSEVVRHVVSSSEGPLAMTENGEVIARISHDTIVTFARDGEGWQEKSRFRIPLKPMYRFAHVASNGIYAVGDSENTQSPPALFLYKRGDSGVSIFSNLNPQFDHLALAPMRNVSWTTSTGAAITGLLFEPPDVQPNHTYPLVIHTKLEVGQFLCDTGDSHYPSFAPQPLADAGIMYLIRTWPEGKEPGSDLPFYPKGYPGGVGEAAFQMDIWDSAVKALSGEGLVDPKRVGIIGFSRTGWYTEFILSHTSTSYRAATITDNVTYGLASYWLYRNQSTNRLTEAIYGGPPNGASLPAWIAYSSSLNADKIKTPILMEEMGYGLPYDNANAPPLGFAIHFELFSALNQLHKGVEMYFYPNEEHQPDHPKARLATLQRNVDWYRFWLQGYERPGPEAREQYSRWRAMREANGKQGEEGSALK